MERHGENRNLGVDRHMKLFVAKANESLVRVGCGSGYWGDNLDPAIELAEKGNLEYMGFDLLAELTMALLHRQKLKDPNRGYIPDIVPWFEKLLPICEKNHIKMITNAGGANPKAAADAVIELVRKMGIKEMKLGVVTGDDLTDKLDDIRATGVKLTNTDTGEVDIDRVKDKIVAAYAYMGSGSIINNWTVKEHLVYEVMDPRNYIMPDRIADFTTLKLQEIGKDKVKVTNMTGKGRPDMIKVCIGVEEGYVSEAMFLTLGPTPMRRPRKPRRFSAAGLNTLVLSLRKSGSITSA